MLIPGLLRGSISFFASTAVQLHTKPAHDHQSWKIKNLWKFDKKTEIRIACSNVCKHFVTDSRHIVCWSKSHIATEVLEGGSQICMNS